MTDQDETQAPAGDGPSAAERVKKPYVKPAFRHEQVFETMALACGKINPTQASCRTNRRNS